MGELTTCRHQFDLPVSRRQVFELLSDPDRLDSLTPPWFRLRPRPGAPRRLAEGTEIAYRFRWRGLPLPWVSRITDWREPEFFAYEQQRGPYRFFRHEHTFIATASGARVIDRALFSTHGGRLFDRTLALPDLRRIFAYRERACREWLTSAQPAGSAGPGAGAPGASRAPRTSAASSAIERPT